MRFKNYMRKIAGRGNHEVIPFGPEHYREAGVPYSLYAGMPVLEAYQLVNKWNSKSGNRFIYFLEA